MEEPDEHCEWSDGTETLTSPGALGAAQGLPGRVEAWQAQRRPRTHKKTPADEPSRPSTSSGADAAEAQVHNSFVPREPMNQLQVDLAHKAFGGQAQPLHLAAIDALTKKVAAEP